MARRGPKPETPDAKLAKGTYRPSREHSVVIPTTSPDLGVTPPELPLDVAVVWTDYVDAAVAHGAKQCDADSFAEWCTMTANLRKVRATGEAAPAAYLQQWRTLGELFGLCGAKSRLLIAPVKRNGPNPFERNGRRPSRPGEPDSWVAG